jgi:hypothetical protein
MLTVPDKFDTDVANQGCSISSQFESHQMETTMKKALVGMLIAALTPISAFANGESLVAAFETYCLKKTENMLALDKSISVIADRHQPEQDVLRGDGDIGYFMTSGGRQYLIEWSGNACRVSSKDVFPNDVMNALATNHILTVPHGDKTDFGRAHWFEGGHELTRFAFTHDLNDSTILFEYQKDDVVRNGPVALTLTR